MNDDEIWELAQKPVTEFVEAIKQMKLNVDKLVEFYIKHTRDKSSAPIKMEVDNSQLETSLQTDNTMILSPLARAKLELAIVFSMNTCYWLYLVTQGEDPKKNEISKDIERIRLFMNRAKEVEASLMDDCSSSKRPKIDKEASKRLCMNNMSLKSNWS